MMIFHGLVLPGEALTVECRYWIEWKTSHFVSCWVQSLVFAISYSVFEIHEFTVRRFTLVQDSTRSPQL